LFLDDEALDRGDECFADGVHEGRGGKGTNTVAADEGGDAAVGLQPGLRDIAIHSVDAFDLEGNVFAEVFGDGPRQTHRWLRSSRPFGVKQPLRGSNSGCVEHTRSRHDRSHLAYNSSV
jgi:hypothetical protein